MHCPFPKRRKTHAKKSCLIQFLSLQEYCKLKKTEDTASPSIYIGLKDKLSGIRKVITDSTLNLIQLLESYKKKLQEFSREGEALSGMVVRKGGTWEGRGSDPFQSHFSARLLVILIPTLFYNCNLKEVSCLFALVFLWLTSLTADVWCDADADVNYVSCWSLLQQGLSGTLSVPRFPGTRPRRSLGKSSPVSWVLKATWTGTHLQLSDFLEEYDIRTQVSAIVQRKYRTSKPEPRTRDEFLQCKLWKAAPFRHTEGSRMLFAKTRTTTSCRGFTFL